MLLALVDRPVDSLNDSEIGMIGLRFQVKQAHELFQ